MKKLGIHLLALSFFCLTLVGVTSVAALADDMKYHQTARFSDDVWVNNTMLKKGTYRITFYADKGEVKFAKENGDEVLTVKATVATLDKDSEHDATQITTTDKGMILTKLMFGGHAKYAVITETTASASMN